jgi:predicted ATP-binding protein involved in virulence
MAFAKAAPVDSISGVVLIDELEQHLHPSWQREVVRALRQQFPGVQFIATTHSALCALGTTAIPDESQVILLRGAGDAVEPVPYSPPESQSVNQILMSPLFGLFSASSFGLAANISRYAKLKAMPERTPEQGAELAELREVLEGALGPFEDEFRRNLERLIREVAVRELAGAMQERGLDSETLGFEIRARLRDLFDWGKQGDQD